MEFILSFMKEVFKIQSPDSGFLNGIINVWPTELR
jgi:hypothetical protein